jgi:SWI/SNF-related matrix-associated actin-dependent regulator of chromatin subfamily A member 5
VSSSLHELWALYHFLYPDVFGEQTADAFKSAFNLTQGTYNTKFIEAASTLLGTLMLRRMKADMDEIKLPPKEELLVYVPLTPLQRFWYKRLITRLDSTALNEVLGANVVEETKSETSSVIILDTPPRKRGQVQKREIPEELRPRDDLPGSNAWAKLMNLLMQLRKTCNQYLPFLFCGV